MIILALYAYLVFIDQEKSIIIIKIRAGPNFQTEPCWHFRLQSLNLFVQEGQLVASEIS